MVRGRSHRVKCLRCDLPHTIGVDIARPSAYTQTMTQTKREYAASLGLAIAGARGKLSKAAHEAIAAAEAGGMQFSDTAYSVIVREKTDPTIVKAKADKKAEKAAIPTPLDFLGPTVQLYPASTLWHGKDSNGKKVTANVAQCCNVCRYSLIGCECGSPTTLTAVYANGKICMEAINLEVEA